MIALWYAFRAWRWNRRRTHRGTPPQVAPVRPAYRAVQMCCGDRGGCPFCAHGAVVG